MVGLRRALRYARACAFDWSGAGDRARNFLDGTRAAVLMYHRVLPAADAVRNAVEPGMYVTPETFARHLEWLATSFRVLPLHEIASRLAQQLPLPAGACAITFDDGWRDNHDFALPALERSGMPATIFVVTDRVGTHGAFWPDEVCRRMAGLSRTEQAAILSQCGVAARAEPVEALLTAMKGMTEVAREKVLEHVRAETGDPSARERELLDWSEIDRLARAGLDIEAHGASHAILTKVTPTEAQRELRTARERLRERGHGHRGLLAYPSGEHDEVVRRLARAEGYAAAFTTASGLASAAADRFSLPRLAVHDDVTRTRVEFRYHIRG